VINNPDTLKVQFRTEVERVTHPGPKHSWEAAA